MNKKFFPYLWVTFFLIAAIISSIAIGSVFISPLEILRGLFGKAITSSDATILWSIRLPRTILLALVGSALAGSGAAYQGLFRNPLADPYLIGVASGGGLGAVFAMFINWPYTFLGLLAVPATAFVASLGTVFLVYLFAQTRSDIPTTNLILAGVAVSSFTGALTYFLMITSTGELRRALNWLLGGVSLVSWSAIGALLPYLAIGFGVLVISGHALNLLQFGDEQATQMGLDTRKAKLIIIAASSLVTAAAVSFAGIIGFVGLVVPHVVRIFWGADYRRIIPLSIIGGAGALLFADILARVILAPQELPVGIVTSLAGAPFFLWVLRKGRNLKYW